MSILGIDLGGTTIKAGILDKNHNILEQKYIPTEGKSSKKEIIDRIINFCIEMKKIEEYDSIGIGIPGLINPIDGIILECANINLSNVNIKNELENALKKPVSIDNDANCAALGEHFKGSAKGYSSSITITLGTGIGGGIIIDNQIYRGKFFNAGEFGHMVICANGRKCGCGKLGHWEAYASASALERSTKLNARKLFELARDKKEIKKELKEYIDYLCVGLSNIIQAFATDVIILGGGVSQAGNILIDLVNEEIDKYIFGENKTKILLAKLGNNAGIIGASALRGV